jgi:hypothetical protein
MNSMIVAWIVTLTLLAVLVWGLLKGGIRRK